MKKIILLIIISIPLISCITKDNTESKLYSSIAEKEWITDAGNLWEEKNQVFTIEKIMIDSIMNSSTDKLRGPSYYFDKLIFKADGTIGYSRLVKNVGLCGNGLMSISKSSWKLNDNKLTVDVKGSFALESDFHYKIEYEVSFPRENKMQLKKIKNILWSNE